MKKVKLNIKILIVIIAVSLVFFSIIISQSNDADADGVIDLFDNCPNTINPNQEDLDADNLGDACDFDDDGDGIVDVIDAFAQNPEEWDDFDFDGIGANEDGDDDGDGILDINDTTPSHPSTLLSMKYLDLIEDCAIMDEGYTRNLCFKDIFVLSIEKGENGFEVIDLAFAFDKLGTIDDCHFTAHHVGYAAFKENPNLTENIMNAVHTCRNGFYHGLLSAFFDDLKDKGEDISNWHKVACDEFVGTKKYKHCVHGIGHGLVFYYEDDLRQSVDACHELSDKPYQNSILFPSLSCVHGVFMQYVDNELTESNSYEEVIPEICSKIELSPSDSYRCHFQIGSVLAFKTNHNLEPALEFCNAVKDQKGLLECKMGVMREFLSSEPDQKLAKCDLLVDEKALLECYTELYLEIQIRLKSTPK